MFWHNTSISKRISIGSNLHVGLLEVAANWDALTSGGVMEKASFKRILFDVHSSGFLSIFYCTSCHPQPESTIDYTSRD